MLERTITGLILGFVMLSSLLFHPFAAVMLLLVILFFSIKEWGQLFLMRSSAQLFHVITFLLILGICILEFQSISLDYTLLTTIFCCVCILQIFIYIYFLLTKSPVKSLSGLSSGIVYIVLPIIIALHLVWSNFETNKYLLISFVITNWSNDTFAYFGGRLFGKTALAPKISPKKTVEGSLVGFLGALTTMLILNYSFQLLENTFAAAILGIAIAMAGSLGDLYESSLKRMINIKDSGNILPGHGGFLDRFDSFFFVLPVGTLLFYFFK